MPMSPNRPDQFCSVKLCASDNLYIHAHTDLLFFVLNALSISPCASIPGTLSKHCSLIRLLKADFTFVQPPPPPPPCFVFCILLGWFCYIASRTTITGSMSKSIGSIWCHSEMRLLTEQSRKWKCSEEELCEWSEEWIRSFIRVFKYQQGPFCLYKHTRGKLHGGAGVLFPCGFRLVCIQSHSLPVFREVCVWVGAYRTGKCVMCKIPGNRASW